jgi:hypothetical protein
MADGGWQAFGFFWPGGRGEPAKGLCAIALVFASLTAFAESFVVPAELWDRPRSGAAVLAQPAVRQAVDRFLAAPGSRLVVRHAATLDSRLAAEELRSWLVALALEPARITLRNDLKPREPLVLEVLGD